MEMRELTMDEVMMVAGGSDDYLQEIFVVASKADGGGSGFFDRLFGRTAADKTADSLENQGYTCNSGGGENIAYICRPDPAVRYTPTGWVVCDDATQKMFASGDKESGYLLPPPGICR